MAVPEPILNLLQLHGFSFRYEDPYRVPYYRTFYRIVSNYIWDSPEHPNAARKRICEFQGNPDYRPYFEAFEPQEQFVSMLFGRTSYNPRDIFENALKVSSSNDLFPSERDIHSAALYLQRQIHMYTIKDQSNIQFRKYGNVVAGSSIEAPLLVFKVQDSGSVVYVEIEKLQLENDDGDCDIDEIPHSFCHCSMFKKTFPFPQTIYNNCERDIQQRTVQMHTKNDEFSVYRCVAKVIYGDENFHRYVKELVDNFKTTNINLLSSVQDMLSTSNPEQTNKKTKSQKKTDIEDFFSGVEVLRICATLYTTDIYVYDGNEWNLFYPLHGFHKVSQTSSYITLQYLDNSKYDILTTMICNCEVPRPNINDKLAIVYGHVKNTYRRKG